MSYTFALAGKGGTGKTTMAGMLIRYLVKTGRSPILAVDADPNANLNEVLGVEVKETLGDAREDMKKGKVPPGMTKDVFMSMRMEEAVIETGEYDLVVMGQPEGAGCYCAANTILTNLLDRLADNYPFIVIDNEAGMEHISRMTTKNVDLLMIVSDPSFRGIQAAIRIHELAGRLHIGVKRSVLIINQAKDEPDPETLKKVEEAGLEFAGFVPEDKLIYEYDSTGRPTIEIPEDSAVVRAAFDIFARLMGDEAGNRKMRAV